MDKEKSGSKRKIFPFVIGFIVAFIVSFYAVQLLFKKQDLESRLKASATELNKQTPMQIDQSTRLDSASAVGKTNFVYHYTLLDVEKFQVNLDTVNKYLRPYILENVKNSPDLKDFRDNKITMDYRYYDKKGVFVTEISATPDLYQTSK